MSFLDLFGVSSCPLGGADFCDAVNQLGQILDFSEHAERTGSDFGGGLELECHNDNGDAAEKTQSGGQNLSYVDPPFMILI